MTNVNEMGSTKFTKSVNQDIKSISIVIPTYNEEGNIDQLYSELKVVLDGMSMEYEILFVDDGSTDDTLIKLKTLLSKGNKLKIIRLRSNFGQSIAMGVGMQNAKGEIIITMDADLQNDPSDIPKLIDKIRQGYDVVSGWRANRHDPISKKIPSKISNWIARKLIGIQIHDFGCTLKAYRKEAISNIMLYGENHRYIPAALASEGYSITEIKVNHRHRHAGKSKYGISRLIRGGLDLVNLAFWKAYSTKPMQFFGKIGIASFLTGFVIAMYKILQLLILGIPLEVGPLLLFSVLLVISGIQFILFGFLSEIQVRVYHTISRVEQGKIEFIDSN